MTLRDYGLASRAVEAQASSPCERVSIVCYSGRSSSDAAIMGWRPMPRGRSVTVQGSREASDDCPECGGRGNILLLISNDPCQRCGLKVGRQNEQKKAAPTMVGAAWLAGIELPCLSELLRGGFGHFDLGAADVADLDGGGAVHVHIIAAAADGA